MWATLHNLIITAYSTHRKSGLEYLDKTLHLLQQHVFFHSGLKFEKKVKSRIERILEKKIYQVLLNSLRFKKC